MGRSGCLTFILIVIIIALLGYNQYRLEQMRREVSAISSKVHVAADKKKTPKGKTDLVTALAEAEKYTKHAKQLLEKKMPAKAQAELDKALKSLKSANTVSSDIVGDAAGYLGKARHNAVTVFQKAWKDISEEAKPKKTGTR